MIVFVDTPGIHERGNKTRATISIALRIGVDDVDVAVFVVRTLAWTSEDERVLQCRGESGCPGSPGGYQGRPGRTQGKTAALL